MNILALARHDCIAHLRRAVRPGEHVVAVTSAATTANALARSPSVLIIDTSLLSASLSESLIRQAERSGIPTALYIDGEVDMIDGALAVLGATNADLLVPATVEEFVALRSRLDRFPTSSSGTEILRLLSPRLRLLPAPLAHAIVMMFAAPGPNDSPKELAATSGIARRSLDRWIGRAGIPSARLLVAAARLCGVHDAVLATGGTIAGILRNQKLGSLVAVRRQSQTLTGWSLNQLRHATRIALVARIDDGLRPRHSSEPTGRNEVTRRLQRDEVSILPVVSVSAEHQPHV